MPRARNTGCRFIRNGDEIKAYSKYRDECRRKEIKPLSKGEYHIKLIREAK